MALRHRDSASYYATAQIPRVWSTNGDASTTIISADAARLGTTGLFMSVTGFVTKTLDSQATWIVGFALRFTAFPPTSNVILQLIDTSTLQVQLAIDMLGRLVVVNGAAVTLGTSAPVLSPNVWYYVEFKSTINNSSGTYDVRVNGVSVLSGTGADTQNSANASANIIRLSSGVSATHFTDIVICDATGSTNNDFLGDVRVQPILPSGAGATTQWTPSAGSNFQNVDDATPDGDTTYNSSSTPNQVDTYAYGNVTPTTGTVFAVGVSVYARKDDAGVRSIAPVVRSGGTDYVGTTQLLSTSYQYHTEIFEENPDTSAAWTIAEVNGAEFGVRLVE